MNLRPGHPTIVIDLGYGDAGKGGLVDWLCSPGDVRTVVRFNGGAQAAHHVIAPGGEVHRFSQFGSGTFHGAETFLSPFTLVDPLRLLTEADRLQPLVGGRFNVLDKVKVDARALLITPWHAAANKASEIQRGAQAHGSCGIGIGETMRYAIDHTVMTPLVGDLLDNVLGTGPLVPRLEAVATWYATEYDADIRAQVEAEWPLPDIEALVVAYEAFAEVVEIVNGRYLGALGLHPELLVFEGAQGVLLDEWHGWHPHTTWSTTTARNAHLLVGMMEDAVGHALPEPYTLGAVRTYTTRHGAGPHVTEDQALTDTLAEPHNGVGRFQGGWRAGHFDAVAHRYAIEAAGTVDGIAVTHCDTLAEHPEIQLCNAWATPPGGRFTPSPNYLRDLDRQAEVTEIVGQCAPVYDGPVTVDRIAEVLATPVVVESHGPAHTDKRLTAIASAL